MNSHIEPKQDDKQPWRAPAFTERQFAAAMRAAGWRNEKQGFWVHNVTGQRFYAFNSAVVNDKVTEQWQVYAARNETPEVENG